MRTPADTHGTAQHGRRLVEGRLRELGARAVQEDRIGRRSFLRVTGSDGQRRIAVFVKTKTSGTWQAQTVDADADRVPTGVETFWIFVDLDGPTFSVVPDQWMRDDIAKAHAAYLARHGGRRARTEDSTHHAIEPRRIRQWRDQWDLLEI